MKKLFTGLSLALILLAFIFINKLGNSRIDNSIQLLDKENNPQKEENYIFVPYWTFSENLVAQKYSSIIYFGISINEFGINRNEKGYEKLISFSDLVENGKRRYLTLRIIGKDADNEFLDNINLQKKIGAEAAEIAKEHQFEGIVVDFETSAFGFSSTEKKITKMYKILSEEIKKENLEFIVTIFGDNYYRARPYNIKEIGLFSDKVIIMAYDFHKARLNPGPNFPLSDEKKYGYSFKKMIDDFEKDIEFKKIVVALGYFGYDWKMENGVSVEMAEPLSLNQIEQRYIESCPVENCLASENNDLESVIKYTDDEGFSHEVWFENEKSAEKKIEFLKNEGINQIAAWAYSYY